MGPLSRPLRAYLPGPDLTWADPMSLDRYEKFVSRLADRVRDTNEESRPYTPEGSEYEDRRSEYEVLFFISFFGTFFLCTK